MGNRNLYDGKTIRHALVSIFVGASVAFISTLLQGTLDFIKHYDGLPGPVAGMITYGAAVWRASRQS